LTGSCDDTLFCPGDFGTTLAYEYHTKPTPAWCSCSPETPPFSEASPKERFFNSTSCPDSIPPDSSLATCSPGQVALFFSNLSKGDCAPGERRSVIQSRDEIDRHQQPDQTEQEGHGQT